MRRGGRPGRGVDDDVVGEPSCDEGGHRLAGVVKDGKVSWRALNTSEPCGLRRPVGYEFLRMESELLSQKLSGDLHKVFAEIAAETVCAFAHECG